VNSMCICHVYHCNFLSNVYLQVQRNSHLLICTTEVETLSAFLTLFTMAIDKVGWPLLLRSGNVIVGRELGEYKREGILRVRRQGEINHAKMGIAYNLQRSMAEKSHIANHGKPLHCTWVEAPAWHLACQTYAVEHYFSVSSCSSISPT
jgi:hypothetical protein